MRVFGTLMKAVLRGGKLPVRLLVRAFFDDGTWGIASTRRPFTYDDQHYDGLTDALTVTAPQYTSDAKAQGFTLNLSATDGKALAKFKDEPYRGRIVEAGLLILDPSTRLPAEEYPLGRGKCDTPSVKRGRASRENPSTPAVHTLSITVTPPTEDMRRVNGRTRSDPDQRKYRDPDDGFFKDTRTVGTTPILWMTKNPTPAHSQGGGSPLGGGNTQTNIN